MRWGILIPYPYFKMSTVEIEAEETSYTYLTLTKLKNRYPDTIFYFIMGADSLFTFEEWKDPDQIARLAVLVAAVRDHVSDQSMELQIQHLTQKYGADIRVLDVPNMDVSSRMLRDWIREDRRVRYYLSDSVIYHFLLQNCSGQNYCLLYVHTSAQLLFLHHLLLHNLHLQSFDLLPS